MDDGCLSILGAIGLVFIIFTCTNEESAKTKSNKAETEAVEEKKQEIKKFSLEESGAQVVVDKETGCEYIVDNSGITPRLNDQGYAICKSPRGKQ